MSLSFDYFAGQSADHLASFPSPSQGVWHLNLGIVDIPIRAYALCIIVGIIVAWNWGEKRWVARGGQPGVIFDLVIWVVPFGLIGGRLYHVITDWPTYFGDGEKGPLDALKIWEGGLGIWGAIALGSVGAWIGCRQMGVSVAKVGDAVAPAILVAQAIGRLGNYFNQELYGRPTSLPWGLEVFNRTNADGLGDDLNGISDGTVVAVVHPTFLYEILWNLAMVAVLLWIEKRFRLAHGRLFAAYVALYCVGRFGIELLRDDHASHLFGLRINTYVSALVLAGALAYIFWLWKRIAGDDDSDDMAGFGRHSDPSGDASADELAVEQGSFVSGRFGRGAAVGAGVAAAAAGSAESDAADTNSDALSNVLTAFSKPGETVAPAPAAAPEAPDAAPAAAHVAPVAAAAASPALLAAQQAAERAAAARAEAEAAEREALAAMEQATREEEEQRAAAEQAAAEQAAREEAERVAAEQAAAEQAAREEAERVAAEQAAAQEAARVEAERVAAEQAAAEQVAAAEAARVEAQRLAAEEAAAEQAERVAAEQAAAEQAAREEAERVAAEQAAAEQAAREEAERVAAEQSARDEAARVEAERVSAEQAAAEQAAREEAERVAAEQAAREEAEQAAAEQAAVEKAAADKAAAEQPAAVASVEKPAAKQGGRLFESVLGRLATQAGLATPASWNAEQPKPQGGQAFGQPFSAAEQQPPVPEEAAAAEPTATEQPAAAPAAADWGDWPATAHQSTVPEPEPEKPADPRGEPKKPEEDGFIGLLRGIGKIIQS